MLQSVCSVQDLGLWQDAAMERLSPAFQGEMLGLGAALASLHRVLDEGERLVKAGMPQVLAPTNSSWLRKNRSGEAPGLWGLGVGAGSSALCVCAGKMMPTWRPA